MFGVLHAARVCRAR